MNLPSTYRWRVSSDYLMAVTLQGFVDKIYDVASKCEVARCSGRRVEFKKQPCRRVAKSSGRKVDFKNWQCRKVDFKKRPGRRVDFSLGGPY